MRITNAALLRAALADVQRQRERYAELQEQAASGLRVNRPSDDPSDAGAALLLRAGIDANEQHAAGITRTRVRVSSTASALETVSDSLLRARELAIQGANDTHDAISRGLIAEEVEVLHARVLAESNTRAGGSFIFSGYASATTPFVASGPFVDGSPSPNVAFVGDASEVDVEVDIGMRLRATLDGRRTFLGDGDGDGNPDPGREDLFAVLGDLRDALRSNDRAAVGDMLPRLDVAIDQLSVARADVGATQTRLEDAESRVAKRRVELAERLSFTQDADTAQVFSGLVTQQAALEASLAAAQRSILPSLLDFLGPV